MTIELNVGSGGKKLKTSTDFLGEETQWVNGIDLMVLPEILAELKVMNAHLALITEADLVSGESGTD